MISRSMTLAGLSILLASCGPMQSGPANRASAGVGNAIVIEDEDLGSSRGSILAVMQDHVSGMSYARVDICPRIILRGGTGRSAAATPVVYVDGQRMSDTCVLESLNIDAISSIEVYPNGVTLRPGYFSNSGGLILVFRRTGPESQARSP